MSASGEALDNLTEQDTLCSWVTIPQETQEIRLSHGTCFWILFSKRNKGTGKRDGFVKCELLLHVTLHCMVITELKPFPRKRVLDNYNIVIHCPSLSRKKLTWKSLLTEMTIFEMVTWKAELSPTGCTDSCAKQVPFRWFSNREIFIFRTHSYLETAFCSELWFVKTLRWIIFRFWNVFGSSLQGRADSGF